MYLDLLELHETQCVKFLRHNDGGIAPLSCRVPVHLFYWIFLLLVHFDFALVLFVSRASGLDMMRL